MEVYIIWDTTNDGSIVTSGHSSTLWKAITAHEIGHALGYIGHSYEKSLMYPSTDESLALQYNTPSVHNFAHLNQLY